MRLFLLTVLGFVLPCLAQGQIRIEGTLLSQDSGEPLEFAVVREQGGPAGCLADEQGRFSLQLPSLPDSLVIIYDQAHEYVWAVPRTPAVGVLKFTIEVPEHYRCFCIAPVVIGNQPHETSMDVVGATEMARGEQSSIEQGLNLVPGVKFESRGAGGSRRLSIRGSLVRSAFGVREVKAYLDGAPLTSPDGSTPLELLDAQGLSRITVLKGPLSDEYGAVSHGVLLAQSRIDGLITGQRGFRLDQQIGSYGYARTALTKTFTREARHGSIHYVHQRTLGYRALESNSKDHLQVNYGWGNAKHKWDVFALGYIGDWGLPGSLDSAQVAANPRQALPYSLAADAHVERRHLRGTAAYAFDSDRLHTKTAAYVHTSDKTNPYGTSPFFQGYKLESSLSTGFRHHGSASFRYDLLTLYWNLEHQTEWGHFREFDNDEGNPGPRRLISRNRSSQSLAHLGAMFHRRHHAFMAEAGLSQVGYSQDIEFSRAALSDAKTTFAPFPAFKARYSFSKGNERKPAIHLTAMNGYSPPAVWEIMDSTGRFSSNLGPERSFNLEARASKTFYFKQIRILTSINAYNLWLLDAILPTTLSSGRTLYQNAGRINTMGLEAQVDFSKDWVSSPVSKRFHLSLNATCQRMIFGSYPLGADDFEGNRVPGAPSFFFNAMLDWEAAFGTSLQLTSSLVGNSFLDNANTVSQRAYNLLTVKVSHSIKIPCFKDDQLMILPSAGVNNLLNARYTNFPQLNASGGKFWNPAPTRNWFAGLNLQF